MFKESLKRIFRKRLPQNAPRFMIIGAQKAGTTALYEYLTQHPQIKGSTQKELHYFDCDNRYSKGIDFYHSLFPLTTKDDEITFDASAGYLASREALKRMYDYNPLIKSVAIIRDPVERAYSAWNMYKKRYERNRNWFFEEWEPYCCNSHIKLTRRNDNSLFDFKNFIIEEIKFIEENPSLILESPVITHGFYHLQLTNYLSLFKREQILIIENSHLRKNTIDVLKQLEVFLEVKAYNWQLNELLPVFEGGYESHLDNETKFLLSEYYIPYNEQLFKLLGLRYSWNNFE